KVFKSGALTLDVTDVHPEFTLGRIELERRQVLTRLRGEGLFDLNRKYDLSDTPLRLALITSSNAAGMTDFLRPLRSSGYAFTVFHLDVPVQGQGMEAAVCNALRTTAACRDEWKLDAVC